MEKESAAALKIRSCCCALAETEYRFNQNPHITSEKNGSYSVTYSAKNSKDHNAKKAVLSLCIWVIQDFFTKERIK